MHKQPFSHLRSCDHFLAGEILTFMSCIGPLKVTVSHKDNCNRD